MIESESRTYRGDCFCGAVELTVTGTPEAMGYCHCESCRKWSAGPVNAFILWKPEQVKVTRGAELIATFNKSDNSFRKWCTVCGGHLMNVHPRWGLIDVYAATTPGVPFRPAVHVNYQDTVLPQLGKADTLPKLKDVPRELGGTAEQLAA